MPRGDKSPYTDKQKIPDRNRRPREPRDAGDDWTRRGPDYERGGPEGLWREPRRGREGRDSDDYGSDEFRMFGEATRPFPQSQHPARIYDVTAGGVWGRFYGRGPKGYRRSDERIREEICERLMVHPDVDASDVEVRVERGVVTLTGTVDDRHQKRIAHFIADDEVGVDDVHNRLTVRHGFWAGLAGERAADSEVRRRVNKEVGKPSDTGGRANAARGAAKRDAEAR